MAQPAMATTDGGEGGEVRLRDLRSSDFDRVLELERRLFGAGA